MYGRHGNRVCEASEREPQSCTSGVEACKQLWGWNIVGNIGNGVDFGDSKGSQTKETHYNKHTTEGPMPSVKTKLLIPERTDFWRI